MFFNNFFKEFKRRNVGKVAIAYGIASWLIIQIAVATFPFLNLPGWAVTMIIWLCILGFPIALVIAWAFELSPKGIIRTTSADAKDNPFPENKKKPFTSNLFIGILFLVVAGQFIYFNYWNKGNVKSEDSKENTSLLSPEIRDSRVAVTVFDNQTLAESLDPYGMMISDWLTRGLMETGEVKISSIENVRENIHLLRKGKSSRSDFIKATGANYLINGRYYLQEDQLIVYLNVEDAENGNIIRTEQVQGNRSDQMQLLDELMQRILGYWVTKDIFEFKDKAPKYDAYAKWMQVLKYYENNLEEAERLCYEALELDSTLYVIYPTLFGLYHNRGMRDNWESIYLKMKAHEGDFSNWEEMYFLHMKGKMEGDRYLIAAQAMKMFELDPFYSITRHNAVFSQLRGLNNPKLAIKIALDAPDTYYREGGWSSWLPARLMEAYYKIGQYDKAAAVIDSIGRFTPFDLQAVIHLRSLVRLGQDSLLDHYYRFYLKQEFKPNNPNKAWLAYHICAEAELASKPKTLNRYLPELKRLAKQNPDDGYAFFIGVEQYWRSNFKTALETFATIDSDQYDWRVWRYTCIGICLAKLNRREEALATIDSINMVKWPYQSKGDNYSKNYASAGVYASLGYKKEAVEQLHEYINITTSPFSFDKFKGDSWLMPLFEYPPFEKMVAY